MASSFQQSGATFESSLPEPPTKRVAVEGESESNLGPNDASSPHHAYSYHPPYSNLNPQSLLYDSISNSKPHTRLVPPMASVPKAPTQSYPYSLPTPSAQSTHNSLPMMNHASYFPQSSKDSTSDTARSIKEEANHHAMGNPTSFPFSPYSSSQLHNQSQNTSFLDPIHHHMNPNDQLQGLNHSSTPSSSTDQSNQPSNHFSLPSSQLSHYMSPAAYPFISNPQTFPPPYNMAAPPSSTSSTSSSSHYGHSPNVYSQLPRMNDIDRTMALHRRHSIAVANPAHWRAMDDWGAVVAPRHAEDDDAIHKQGEASDEDEGPELAAEMEPLRPKGHPPGGNPIEGQYMSLLVGPGEHQVKDFNILPFNIVRINYDSKCNEFIAVHLVCDPKLRRNPSEIFLTATSTHHGLHDGKKVVLPNLKISQNMLRGRTKGFLFHLKFTLYIEGREAESLVSEPFYLWSNVSQRYFPRQERENYAQETQNISIKKRKRK